MSDQRPDSESQPNDAVEAPSEGSPQVGPPSSASSDNAALSASQAEARRRARRTVRIPGDEVVRPLPSDNGAGAASAPIMGQRIISIGEPTPPSRPEPREPVQAARTVEVPAMSMLEAVAMLEDSWTPYQPSVERVEQAQPPAPLPAAGNPAGAEAPPSHVQRPEPRGALSGAADADIPLWHGAGGLLGAPPPPASEMALPSEEPLSDGASSPPPVSVAPKSLFPQDAALPVEPLFPLEPLPLAALSPELAQLAGAASVGAAAPTDEHESAPMTEAEPELDTELATGEFHALADGAPESAPEAEAELEAERPRTSMPPPPPPRRAATPSVPDTLPNGALAQAAVAAAPSGSPPPSVDEGELEVVVEAESDAAPKVEPKPEPKPDSDAQQDRPRPSMPPRPAPRPSTPPAELVADAPAPRPAALTSAVEPSQPQDSPPRTQRSEPPVAMQVEEVAAERPKPTTAAEPVPQGGPDNDEVELAEVEEVAAEEVAVEEVAVEEVAVEEVAADGTPAQLATPAPPPIRRAPDAPPPPPREVVAPAASAAVAAPTLEKGGPPPPKELTLTQPGAPAASAASDANRKKPRVWWEELFSEDFQRAVPKRQVHDGLLADVHFIDESLAMEKGATILDLGCGTGRQAIEMSKRGYRMVGLDLSLPMLARAAENAQAQEQRINFVQADMREMQFEGAFDAVYCWDTSFGYFDDEKNVQVIGMIHRALRSGGRLLLDIINRDHMIMDSPNTAWFEGDGCVCLDEMHFDWITSRMRVKRTMMFDEGRNSETEYSIRLYSLHELGRLLHEQGFRVAEVSGMVSTPGVYFGCQSPRTIILAEKR